MTIRSWCRGPASMVPPDTTLRAAAQRMEKEGIGLLIVTERDRLVGVVADRDVALAAAVGGHDPATAPVGDVLAGRPVAVRDDGSIEETLGLMRDGRVRRLPVVDQESRIIGVVGVDDLVRLLAREIGGLGEVLVAQVPPGSARPVGHETASAQPRRTAQHFVRAVETCAASARVTDAAARMRAAAVGSVVVLDEAGRATGIVTDRDVALRVVAAGHDPAGTPVSAVMSAPVVFARPHEPLDEVVERMRVHGVRRIPILQDERPVGLVAFDDLLVTFGEELHRIGGCVDAELRSARVHGQIARLRHEVEERIEDAAGQLRQLGEQSLRSVGSELEHVVDRVFRTIRGATDRAAGGPDREALTVRDLMETEVWTCRREDPLTEPARIMWERDCGCVPVVASGGSGRVVGMVTDRDLCMALHLQGGGLADVRVGEITDGPVHTVREDARPSEAERIMQDAQVRRLPVVDQAGRLCGLVSLADLAAAAAGRRGPAGAVDEAGVAHTLAAICRGRRAEPEAEAPREPTW